MTEFDGKQVDATAKSGGDAGPKNLQAEKLSERPQGIELLLFRIKNWWLRVKRHEKP